MPKLSATVAVAAVLAFAVPAPAQRVDDSFRHAAVFAPADAPPAALALVDARASLGARAARVRGRNVLIGGLVGGVVGAVAGTAILYGADEYLGAPPHILTIPLGVVLGAGVGALVP